MLYIGILIGASATSLGFILSSVFKQEKPKTLSEYDVEIKTPNGWHRGQIKFNQTSTEGKK